MDKPHKHISVGPGWIGDEARVALSNATGWITYLKPANARFLAMQLLIVANEIDKRENQEGVDV